jgi:ribosomal protein S25
MTKKKQEQERQKETDKKEKGKTKKWGTAAKEKEERLQRALVVENEVLTTIKDDVAKMRLITPGLLAQKYSIRISYAKQLLRELAESNVIKPYVMANKLRVYTTA